MLRAVQLQLDEAPLPRSLALYSASTYESLQRVPKQSLQLAQQGYQRTCSELCTVTLASSLANQQLPGLLASPLLLLLQLLSTRAAHQRFCCYRCTDGC